jgi:2-dehydro-3-deoxyglucarate aldolase/4-hydroxy-2-oxoheptanedioate aldolase
VKSNRFKQLLAEGQVPVGHMVLEFATRGMPHILEETGVDFVVVDMEHSAFTIADIADAMTWFKSTSIAPFVRVPQVEYHFISRSLEAGALGIMVPDVKNGAEARAVVEAAKYAPLGRRGIGIGAAVSDFKRVDAEEFMIYANENTTVICQIESQVGLDHLEEIASTPGVDVLWVGQVDLSHSLGIAGQFHHPRFVAALEQVIGVAEKCGLATCIQPGSLCQARDWLNMGFSAISYSGDLFIYIDALSQAVTDVRKMTGDG